MVVVFAVNVIISAAVTLVLLSTYHSVRLAMLLHQSGYEGISLWILELKQFYICGRVLHISRARSFVGESEAFIEAVDAQT
jgi:hypothetical protein